MTRIGTFGQSDAVILDMMRTQQRMFETQEQISTGKRLPDYKYAPQDIGSLLDGKSAVARVDQYLNTGKRIMNQMETSNIHLESLNDIAADLRDLVMTSLANESSIAINDELDNLFQSTVGILNSKFDGKHLFSGSRIDQPTVNISTIADLVAAASAAVTFDNDNLKATALVSETETIEYGVLGSDAAGTLMAAMKRIADFNAGGSGPFTTPLTAAQATFLTTEVSNLSQVIDDFSVTLARNGLNMQRMDRLTEQHQSEKLFAEQYVSELEDVDLAEAITKLNRDQTSLEATFQVLRKLSDTSLLDYI